MTMSRMRPEARPLRLDVLDYYQKEAIDRISAVLLEALEAVEDRDCSPETPKGDLDAHRASRLFFLSGEAGGGKTTVYLTLRKNLTPYAKAPAEKDLQNDGKKLEMFEKLWPKREKLIWLEPLDLEYAPGAHNFLAATLVRIDRALSEKEGGARGKDRRRGVLESASDEARQKFENLRNNVVLAWEGNLRERAAHTEPELYSMEVLRSADASLGINTQLQETLEGMMKEDDRCRESLFILPVDDFYLNPSSSLDLLRLLRMISIPRLFVLILGDYYTIEELFYQNMLGKLVGLAGEHTFSNIERQQKILTSQATALAAHSLRKLIPAAQQYRLQVMHQLGALKFHPSRLDPTLSEEAKKSHVETLEWLLTRLPVKLERLGEARDTLLKFLRLRGTDDEKRDDEYYTYSGLAILDLPPREVVDLWQRIMNIMPPMPADSEKSEILFAAWGGQEGQEGQKKGQKKGWEETLAIVGERAVDAIFGQTYITKDDQDYCSFAVKGSRYYDKSFSTKYLRVKPDLAPLIQLPLESDTTLIASEQKGWLFYPNRGDAPEPMAPRPTAWLTVLHDLMALSGDDLLIGEPLTPEPFKFGLVQVKRKGDTEGVSTIGWPTPRWISFWHFDRLSFAWRNIIKEARDRKKRNDFVEWLVFHWMRNIVDILLDQQKLDVEPKESDTEPRYEADWSGLIKQVKKLRSEAEKKEPETRAMIEDWLMHLAILLSPLLAVSETTRKRLSPSLNDLWKKKEKEIKMVREGLEAKRSIKPDEKATP